MPELAVSDGSAPPADLPRGEFICTRLENGSLRIDRADPRILISGELLDQIWMGTPWAVLDTRGCCTRVAMGNIPGQGNHLGAVVKIAAVNQMVIYRITEYLPRINGYIGEWPD